MTITTKIAGALGLLLLCFNAFAADLGITKNTTEQELEQMMQAGDTREALDQAMFAGLDLASLVRLYLKVETAKNPNAPAPITVTLGGVTVGLLGSSDSVITYRIISIRHIEGQPRSKYYLGDRITSSRDGSVVSAQSAAGDTLTVEVLKQGPVVTNTGGGSGTSVNTASQATL